MIPCDAENTGGITQLFLGIKMEFALRRGMDIK